MSALQIIDFSTPAPACLIPLNKPRSSRQREAGIPRRALPANEAAWSRGETVFNYTRPLPSLPSNDVSKMSISELRKTQRAELPSISAEAFALTGQGILSLDQPFGEDGTSTLEETIPADDPRYDALVTIIDPADMTAEQAAAYEEFVADHMASHGRHLVPYVTVHPEQRKRIEFEQRRFADGPIFSTKIVADPAGGEDQVRCTARNPETVQRLVADFLSLLESKYGFIPTAAQIAKRAQGWAEWRRNVGYNPSWYRDAYLPDDRDPMRFAFEDRDLHGPHEYYVTDEDDIPVTDAAGKPVKAISTGYGRLAKYASPTERLNTGLWHGILPEATPLGEADSDPWTVSEILGDMVIRAFGLRLQDVADALIARKVERTLD